MMDTKLVEMYYTLISWDHHKSRDLCFLVEVSYDDGQLSYFASHPGYINEFSSPVKSMEDGWKFLNDNLRVAVEKAINEVREVQSMTPEEREQNWLVNPDIPEEWLKGAEDYLKEAYGK